jgi:hypothetical protein
VNEDDVIDLLTMAAAIDQRTVGEADVTAWLAIAHECDWTPATARRALVEHYANHAERLMPAHITRRIAAQRERIRRTYVPVAPPAELRDDPTAERLWLRERARRWVAIGLEAWATGQAQAAELESAE